MEYIVPTPDDAAATLCWRGESLPTQGATLRVTHTRGNGRSFSTKTETAKVATVSLAGDVLTINNVMRLDATRLTDRWTLLLAPTSGDQAVSLAEVSAPAPDAQNGRAVAAPFASDGSPDPDPVTLPDMQRRWFWCKQQAEIFAARVKVLTAEQNQLEELIIDSCLEQGIESPPGVDNRTYSFAPVYQVVRRVNDDGEKYGADDVIEALKASGLDVGLVGENFHGGQLRALLSQRAEQGMELPEELARVVTLEKRSSLRSTPMAAKKQSGAKDLRGRSAR
jgi:hypothetical protein